MQAFIGSTLLMSREAQPRRKPFDIYDCRLPGVTLRVQPSGVRSYYARFGRSRRLYWARSERCFSTSPAAISGARNPDHGSPTHPH